ncbi:Maf-like protein [Musa troglodytarum]|uniref:Maf-like protein n=1 Tax=Musa troglodytarum TaxID=320322 RepID=A0A9E7JZ89_9LILI|nr:Maf-like protein [Musa troglodytarum]
MALWQADHHKTPSSHLCLCLWGFGWGGLQQRIRPTKMSPSDSSFKMILGSSSRSRRQILSEMGYDFVVLSADIDEKEIRRHTPEELVMVLAEAKADAIISKLRSSGFKEEDAEPTLLITADQVVVHGGMIREKPSSTEEAREFIKGYSAGHASTVGSVLVTNLKTGVRKGGCDKAEIYFHKIPDEIIDSLIEEGDVLYVAGGLMVEHPLTSPFVEAIPENRGHAGALARTAVCILSLPSSATACIALPSLPVVPFQSDWRCPFPRVLDSLRLFCFRFCFF